MKPANKQTKVFIPQLKASSTTDEFNTTTELRRELTRLTNRFLKQNPMYLKNIEEFILAINLYISRYNSNSLNTKYFCLHAGDLKYTKVIDASTYTIITTYFNYILNSPRFERTCFLIIARNFALKSNEIRAKVILPVIKLALQKHLVKRTAP